MAIPRKPRAKPGATRETVVWPIRRAEGFLYATADSAVAAAHMQGAGVEITFFRLKHAFDSQEFTIATGPEGQTLAAGGITGGPVVEELACIRLSIATALDAASILLRQCLVNEVAKETILAKLTADGIID